MWWCWQFYRCWVPYSADLNVQIEEQFLAGQPMAAEQALFVIKGVEYNIDFAFSSDSGPPRPHQFRIDAPYLHREVQRLPTLEDPRLDPEMTLRHMDFSTLVWMAEIHGKQRLSLDEQRRGELLFDGCRRSALRTAQELSSGQWRAAVDHGGEPLFHLDE
jgi:hypothetical protein